MPSITLTPIAKAKLDEYLGEESAETAVRIVVDEDGTFGLSLDSKAADDFAWEAEGMTFCVESEAAPAIEGLRIDYLEQGASSGFSLVGGDPAARVKKADW